MISINIALHLIVFKFFFEMKLKKKDLFPVIFVESGIV